MVPRVLDTMARILPGLAIMGCGPILALAGFNPIRIIVLAAVFGLVSVLLSVIGTPRRIILSGGVVRCKMWAGNVVIVDADSAKLYTGGRGYWSIFAGWLLVGRAGEAVYIPAVPTNWEQWVVAAQNAGLCVTEERPLINGGNIRAFSTLLASLKRRSSNAP